jgi:large subunit ribosomal protein L9
MSQKATQAILLEDVEKLGRKGDVVNVSRGYMRNYLQPRRLAEAATESRVAEIRRNDDLKRRHEAQSDEQARDVAHTLNRTVLTIKRRAGTEDRLFGSVTSTDVSEAIWKARRIRVDRRKIDLEEPIKTLGSFRVALSVYGDVRATLKVMVVPGDATEEGGVEAFEAEPSEPLGDYETY